MTARVQDELVGRSLGAYTLRERIGEGGFGAVYRAAQTALEREVVIKVLHRRLRSSIVGVERFLREAKLASKLDHPYAAHIYASGFEPDGTLWIAMELVRGTPLNEILEVQGPMPVERFAPLLDRICEVVHTAHEQGIVHRDLKPANVMVLARAGRLLPKLLDFGIAKGLDQLPLAGRTLDDDAPEPADTDIRGDGPTLEFPSDAESGPSLTQRGAVIGSPLYMAPEQWKDASSVDKRCDLYALGVLAYQVLTGAPPFTGTTITEIMVAHAGAPVPPVGPKLPAALDEVFGRVLAKQPGDRYPDALAFATAFREAAGLTAEPASLPALDAEARDAALADAPQPIAEAVTAVEGARNAHQARDAIWQLARTAVRYLGGIAIASRSRTGGDRDAPAAAELLRTLNRRTLSDLEWLELGRALTAGWVDHRDAYPLPDLVDLFHGPGGSGARATLPTESGRVVGSSTTAPAVVLEELCAMREESHAGLDDEELRALLERAAASATRLLQAIAFLHDYPLVLPLTDGLAERWMGVRRSQRTPALVRGRELAPGRPALLDETGVPVLTLAPLLQIAEPVPGAPAELFMFEGRGRRGAKLVALPAAFEIHDDTLWDWFRVQLAGSLDDADLPEAATRSPYRGLATFSAGDAAQFVGREQLVDALINRLQVQPLLTIVGGSGAGKSSLVHAGIVPALPAGWRAIAMRPGPEPIASLATRLVNELGFSADGLRAALAGDRDALGDRLRAEAAARGPLVLVVDQLEEVLTLCSDARERDAFAAALAGAARSSDEPVRVVVTLRDDFLVRLEQLPALRNRVSSSLQLVTVPTTAGLLRILVEPARRAGYELEDTALAEEIVREVADQPGALALLSFTASRLWELRDRHFKQLTRAAYQSLGGVGGALAQHAEQTLDAMPEDERGLARELFRHLVTTEHTRTVIARSELVQLVGERAGPVIEKLVAARLLVASENAAGEDTIEIIHETLLVAWPRLIGWVREDVEGARLREQLRSAAKQWHERGRAKGLLWRGDALADLARWRARHGGPLTDTEEAFADASAGDAARGRRIRGGLIVTAFAILVVVVIILVKANQDATAAERQKRAQIALLYEEQARQRFVEGQVIQSAELLAKARDAGGHGDVLDYLTARTDKILRKRRFQITSHAAQAQTLVDNRSRIVVTFGEDNLALASDLTTGRELARFVGHTEWILAADLSADGRRLVTASKDGTARVWDVASGRQLHTLVGHEGWVVVVHFDAKGELVVTGGRDGTARVWRVADGTSRAVLRGHTGLVQSVAVSPDGEHVYTADRATIARWNVASGHRVEQFTYERGVADMVATPTGWFASLDRSGSFAVWRDGAPRTEDTINRRGDGLAIADDGATVAVASDHEVILWRRGGGTTTLTGLRAKINRLAFSADGHRVAAACEDGTARMWNVESGVLESLIPSPSSITAIALSPDGKSIAVGGRDVAVWSSEPDLLVRSLARDGRIRSASFANGIDALVTASSEGWVDVRALDGRSLFGRKHPVMPHHAVTTRDGAQVVLAAEDGISAWDASGQRRAFDPREADIVSLDPANERVLATYQDGHVRVWELATGRMVRDFVHDGTPLGHAAWSSDGSTIASCTSSLKIWRGDEPPATTNLGARCQYLAFDERDEVLAIATGTRVRLRNLRLDLEHQIETQDLVWGVSLVGELVITAGETGVTVWDRERRLIDTVFRGKYAAFELDRRTRRFAVASGSHAHVFDLPTR